MEALERRGKLVAVAAILYIVFWSNCKGVDAKNHSMSYVCPPQFIRLGHSCYFFSEDKATWHSALFFCKDRDSNLSVPARWEDRNLRNYLNKQQIDKASRWIGGIYDMASQAWKWGGELRSMHYQSFSKMKKLTASQLQFQCIAMMPELLYRWAPKSCFEPRQFICQTKIKKVHKSKLKELQKRYQRMGKINEITAPSVSREVNDNRINEVTINPVLNPKSYDLRPSPLRRGPKKNPNRNKTHGPRQNELRKRSRPHAERRLKRPFPGYQWNRLKPQESYQHNVEVLLSGRTGLSAKRVKYHLSRLQRLRDRQLHRMQNDDWLDNTPAIVHTHARTYTINNNISALHPKTIVEEFEMLAPPPVVMPRPTRGICGTISICHRSVVEGGMASGQFTRDRAVDPWSWNASSDFNSDAMTEDIPETGAVFTFGKSHFADNEPSHFFIKNDPIVAISCGDEHSAVICQNGRVFVFGANSWGQLGLGHKDEVTRPSCVKFLKPHRAVFVACGRAHTVFVTDTNAIYSVGCNDQGQLGSGDLEQHSVPQYVELQVSVRHVSAGSDHTALLTEDGRVFVCGSNAEGQLGLGEDTRSALAFTELKFMESIAFVECGYYHTVFITVKGAVFITGDNENQKLGIPNTLDILYVPQILPLDVQIKSACCGANHTFLLSMDESKILAFGSNEKGQLGMPKDVVNVTEPTEINMEKMFDGYQLKLVACGAMHTAFVTDNGLLYTCGEARHNKLCLEDSDDNTNSNELPNQYSPQRVTSMNGFVVDNVSCGGCHTLLTATKGSNADFTNNDFSIISEENRPVSLTELPPLQKVPAINKTEDTANSANSNIDRKSADLVNGNINDESRSIDSLEANVSGSHIVDINDLETDNKSLQDLANLNAEDHNPEMEFKKDIDNIMESLETETNKAEHKIDNTVQNVTETIHTQAEVIEDVIKKTVADFPSPHHDEKKVLEIPNKVSDITHSPPPKTPIIQDLLDIPDITQMSPNLSKHSDDGQKSETGQSENETIPCGSDKSSPQAKTKTQAVMPIVRSEDHIDGQEDGDVVVSKIEKGRFARMFQSIRDKEHSCMGKGKVIEEKIVENIHKGLEDAEETVHKVEERVETEIRNQTNSRTCTIL